MERRGFLKGLGIATGGVVVGAGIAAKLFKESEFGEKFKQEPEEEFIHHEQDFGNRNYLKVISARRQGKSFGTAAVLLVQFMNPPAVGDTVLTQGFVTGQVTKVTNIKPFKITKETVSVGAFGVKKEVLFETGTAEVEILPHRVNVKLGEFSHGDELAMIGSQFREAST